MNEDKASRYHRLKRRSAVASVGLTAVMLGGLLVSGGSVALADIARVVAQTRTDSSPLAVAVYVLILGSLHEALALPLAFYHGFFLDRRYGLSSEPIGGWLRDHAKAIALGAVLAIAGAEIVSAALRMSPSWWWLASAAAFIIAMGLMAKIAPIVLLPLFYKFTPLDRKSLGARLVSLSQRAGVPALGREGADLMQRGQPDTVDALHLRHV